MLGVGERIARDVGLGLKCRERQHLVLVSGEGLSRSVPFLRILESTYPLTALMAAV